MADSASVDSLLHLTRRLSSTLPLFDYDPCARQLHLSIVRLDHCLLDIRKSLSPCTSLLWIDDVIASLDSLLRHLNTLDNNNNTATQSQTTLPPHHYYSYSPDLLLNNDTITHPNNSTITSSSNHTTTPMSSMSPTHYERGGGGGGGDDTFNNNNNTDNNNMFPNSPPPPQQQHQQQHRHQRKQQRSASSSCIEHHSHYHPTTTNAATNEYYRQRQRQQRPPLHPSLQYSVTPPTYQNNSNMSSNHQAYGHSNHYQQHQMSSPSFQYERRHTDIGETITRTRRRSLASLFTHNNSRQNHSSSRKAQQQQQQHQHHHHHHHQTSTTMTPTSPHHHRHTNNNNSPGTRTPNNSNNQELSRSLPSIVFNNPFSERLISSFARLVTPNGSSSPVAGGGPGATDGGDHHHKSQTAVTGAAATPTSPSPHTFASASRTVDEWVTAVRAAKDDERAYYEEVDSCVSISDALPPLPQHYLRCRDVLYDTIRDVLLRASIRAAPSSSSSSAFGGGGGPMGVGMSTGISSSSQQQPNDVDADYEEEEEDYDDDDDEMSHHHRERQRRPPATAVALYGPHGVGKTMLAMELVHDVDICHNFAEGVAWIQLGPDITDEELAENLIRCVDTIIASDFRSAVKYYNSIETIVAHAARVLSRTSCLVVIDDVSGPRGQRAFELVTSALGPSCVALYTTPCADHLFEDVDDDDDNGDDDGDHGDGNDDDDDDARVNNFNNPDARDVRVRYNSNIGDDDDDDDDDDIDDEDDDEEHEEEEEDEDDDDDSVGFRLPSSPYVTCVAKIPVRCLDTHGHEAVKVFRNWLTKTASDESRDGSLKHKADQTAIVQRCFGLPLALAMAGGFLSRFHNSWNALSTALRTSGDADESILRILRLLHVKGGARFDQQLKAIGSLPRGMWVSLSVLADLWETDYRTIKVSARRLGRIAFGEYRLGDSSDESRVRFHYHVVKYCERVTTESDVRNANRRLLTNLSRRRRGGGGGWGIGGGGSGVGVGGSSSSGSHRVSSSSNNTKMKVSDNAKHNMLSSSNNSGGSRTNSNNKIEYLPWWSGVVTDKYLCRRLHWHIDRSTSSHDANSPSNSNDSSDSLSHHHHHHHHHNRYDDYEHSQLIQSHRNNQQQQHTLFDMVCDYQWVCHRVEHDGLLGMMSEFKEAMLAADRVGRDDEFNGIGRIATAVQEAARMRQDDMVDMNVWPTFLEMVLRPYEARSECVRDFLSSMYDKARRPWLKPMPPVPLPLTLPSAATTRGVVESSLSSSPSTSPTAGATTTAPVDDSGGTMVDDEHQYMTGAAAEESYEEDNYHCLASSASGKVICGDSYGNVHVYDPASGQRVTSWAGSSLATVFGGGGVSASALRLGSTLGSGSGSGGSGTSAVGGGYNTTSAALSSDPRSRAVGALGTVQDYVISGHDNGLLILRSIRSGRWEVLHNGAEQREQWSCIGTTDDGVVAVGSRAGTIFVLKGIHGLTGTGTGGTTTSSSSTTNNNVKRIDLQGHCNTVTALYVFPDRERIASSSVDGFAAVWKLRPSTGPGGVKYHQRISLNGHKPDIGHKENCISTFASVANGKRLLSACRGGVVAAWNSATGDCLWTRRYGYEFSRSSALHAFGVGQFAADIKLSSSSGSGGSGSGSSPALGGSNNNNGGDHHAHRRRHHQQHHNQRRSGGGTGPGPGGGSGGGGSSSTLQRKLHKQQVDLQQQQQQQRHAQHGLRVGYPYLITRGDGPNDLMIVSAGEGREVVATVSTDEIISTWLEVWHASSRRIYIAVSHADGKLSCYELVTSLR